MVVGPSGQGMFPGLMGVWDPGWEGQGNDDNPFRRDAAVRGMVPGWELMDSVTSGTERLRQLAQWYLPQEPREDLDAWGTRVRRSILSPFTTRLIENAAGAVLRRPVQIEGVRYWSRFARNVDGIGSSVNEFARRLLVSSLTYGHSAVLVDYPDSSADRTLLDERLAARRPYFNHVRASRILGWRQASDLPSSPLSQVRIHEYVREPKGRYGERIVDQARVIEPGRYLTVKKRYDYDQALLPNGQQPAIPIEQQPALTDESQWQEFSLPIIPLVPMYTNRVGTLRSTPLLGDIAHINIAHYQRQADFLHALHIAAMPNLVLEGWNDAPSTSVGVNYALGMEPGNKAYYIQSDASSFEAQANALLMLETQMSNLGVTKLLGQKFVAESAEAKSIDQEQANSVLSIISMELEACLQQCFNIAALYMGISPPEVRIDRDFSFGRLIGQDISVLGQLAQQGLMSPEAFVQSLYSGDVYPDSMNVTTETAFVKASLEEAKRKAEEQMLEAQTNPPPDQDGGNASGATPATASPAP